MTNNQEKHNHTNLLKIKIMSKKKKKFTSKPPKKRKKKERKGNLHCPMESKRKKK